MNKVLISIILITGLFAQSNKALIGGINYSTFTGSDNELEDVKPDIYFLSGLPIALLGLLLILKQESGKR